MIVSAGFCKVVASNLLSGTLVDISEILPTDYSVKSIRVDPPGREIGGSEDLQTGAIAVKLGPRVTEVTFENENSSAETGFLEICKTADSVAGEFTFTIEGVGGGVTIAPGSCSLPIEVPVGRVVIKELPGSGYEITKCTTVPAGRQRACGKRRSVVRVVKGGIDRQTIAFIKNGTPNQSAGVLHLDAETEQLLPLAANKKNRYKPGEQAPDDSEATALNEQEFRALIASEVN